MAWPEDDDVDFNEDPWDEEDEDDLLDNEGLDDDDFLEEKEEDEDDDWFPQEIRMANEEKVEKLKPLVTAHEEVLLQQKDLREQIANLNTKVLALEKQRLASITTVTAILGENESYIGGTFAFTRLSGVLYVATVVK